LNFKHHTAIVLVEPQGALNIGSVSRAMMNFGFTDLRLVNPQDDHLGNGARLMAVKAEPLLEQATVFPDLASALADCHLCFGTTRRLGKYRRQFIYPDKINGKLSQLPESGRAALVFGREDNGLTTAELDLCQVLVTIPADQALPSLNLAQAVCICLYEAAKTPQINISQNTPQENCPANNQELENMYQHMRRTLLEINYLDFQNPDHILRIFRRIFNRAGLNPKEINILRGLWSRIDWLNKQRLDNTKKEK
jgi:tRNA/rRNA methyltransferase